MRMLTTTKMLATKMPIVMLQTLLFSILLPPVLPFLIFLPPALRFLAFLPSVLSPLVLLPPCYSSGLLNHGLSSPLFYSSSCFCLSLFSFSRLLGSDDISHLDLDANFPYATPSSPSLIRVFRAILLLLEKDYAVRSISLLGTSKK